MKALMERYLLTKMRGAVPLLRGWRKGVGEYHSIILVRKDSGITSVEDLKGKMIAFSEQKSTTGHFLPETYLVTSGLTLSEQTAPNATVPGNEVGYIFAGSPEKYACQPHERKSCRGC